MARNDEFFLTKWIDYYGNQLGKENLYVFFDGTDQTPPPNAEGVNIAHYEHLREPVIRADKMRVMRLSDEAAKLFQRYDLVIGTDADEFLVVDPRTGQSLVEYLSGIKINPTVSGLGLDVGQHTLLEKPIRTDQPFLAQRKYALISSRYTKAVVMAKPLRWGSGFHRVKKHNFRIDKNLYLFHFGCVDLAMLEHRLNDKDRIASGWERHLHKRTRTITRISSHKSIEGDQRVPFARFLQSWVRPIYSWNKPAMMGWKPVVRIPERFRKSV